MESFQKSIKIERIEWLISINPSLDFNNYEQKANPDSSVPYSLFWIIS